MAGPNEQVEEMQGIYGPFTMAERVVQKIWLHGDFDQTRATLTDGRRVEIRAMGAWNLLGGPDFRGARVLIDNQPIVGDVEVHFHNADWRAHGHEQDPAYDNVVLHVVLFPPYEGEKLAWGQHGRALPTLVLLPLLYRDLEEYASDDALEVITARDEWRYFADLAAHSSADLRRLIQAKAHERWRQKVHFARVRVEKSGFRQAAHEMALEILGYRQNRAVMLAIAAKYPVEMWAGAVDVPTVFAENKARWRLQGVRPANHPHARLQQYQRWVIANPDWPGQVARLADGVSLEVTAATSTKTARRTLGLSQRRKVMAQTLTNDFLRGARFDTLVCDGMLPLLSADTDRDWFALWFHWFLGDVPDRVRRVLLKLGLADGRSNPLCHGYAQGLLLCFLEIERRASA